MHSDRFPYCLVSFLIVSVTALLLTQCQQQGPSLRNGGKVGYVYQVKSKGKSIGKQEIILDHNSEIEKWVQSVSCIITLAEQEDPVEYRYRFTMQEPFWGIEPWVELTRRNTEPTSQSELVVRNNESESQCAVLEPEIVSLVDEFSRLSWQDDRREYTAIIPSMGLEKRQVLVRSPANLEGYSSMLLIMPQEFQVFILANYSSGHVVRIYVPSSETEIYEISVSGEPSAEYDYCLSRWYLDNGNYSKAREYFDKAVNELGNPDIHSEELEYLRVLNENIMRLENKKQF